ncbi:hypothetical protein ACO0RG_004680 [Hanseniaspora osmophila]|uniref:Protein HRB1 n=1 Tax=Hanseniaspora osmophila TaxID=56408 RepID=A0A1E5S069_9ASCO|nr:Protein HRB1 [Hanseniaspora osmophila]
MRESEYQRSRSRSPVRRDPEDRRNFRDHSRSFDSRRGSRGSMNDYQHSTGSRHGDRRSSSSRDNGRRSSDRPGMSSSNNNNRHGSNNGRSRNNNINNNNISNIHNGRVSSSSTSSYVNKKPQLGYSPPRVEGASYEDKMNRNYSKSVFVGNLPYDCEAADLEDYFSKVGRVIRADIVTNRGRHRGMGTVEFESRNAVDAAIRELDHSNFMEREIFVREDNPPPPSSLAPVPLSSSRTETERGRDANRSRHSNHNNTYSINDHTTNNSTRSSSKDTGSKQLYDGFEVFIANLPFSINWQALKDMFKKFGDVKRADVSLDHNQRSRGFGTVYFKTAKEAEDSIAYYAGLEMEGRRLDCKKGRYGWGASSRAANSGEHSQSEHDDVNLIDEDVSMSSGRQIKNGNSRHLNSEFVEGARPGGSTKSKIVYVSNLPLSTAQSDLYDLFDTFGKVNRAELKLVDGDVNGEAVVKYDNLDSAEMCVDRLDKYVYGGCELHLSFSTYSDNNYNTPDTTAVEDDQQ